MTHILIYKATNEAEIVMVGLDKVKDEWQVVSYDKKPLTDYAARLAYLRGQGHTIELDDLDIARQLKTPVIAAKPGATNEEALEGANWFRELLESA
jgi:hypothetical protein